MRMFGAPALPRCSLDLGRSATTAAELDATTLIAAEMTGRSCHAIELSPAYVDVAVARWEAFTGHQAVREGDGALFSGLGPGPGRGAPSSPTEGSHATV